MKKNLVACILVLAIVLSYLTACTSASVAPTTAPTTAAAEQTTAAATEAPTTEAAATTAPADTSAPVSSTPKFEDIVFPDNEPAEIAMGDDSQYGYDDLTAKYDVEILSHTYGQPMLPPDQEPVTQWLDKVFNLNITFTGVNDADRETTINTRFAAGDYPDLTNLTSREQGFTFAEQNLLVDAKTIYPLMPQIQKYVTKNMIAWSTDKANSQIPFITKYGIQDGVWGFAIRKDWLAKFNMQPPTTKAALLEYAKACVSNDPDGNGKADTYFMSGAGGGKGWGMLGGFQTAFGNPASHVENGALAHPYFDGVEKNYLMLLKEFYDAKVFCPDWYTIDWETNKSNTMNDKLGMVWYPAGALYGEYTTAKNMKANNDTNFDVWEFYHDYPIENGKYNASGNPGYLTAFAAAKFTDEGKLKRVAHMLDTMVIGGSQFFNTIQGSTPEVMKNAGVQVTEDRGMFYTDDKKAFYIQSVKDPKAMPWTDPNSPASLSGPWQVFGLSVSYQISDPNAPVAWDAAFNKVVNNYAITVNGYDRWTNDGLLVSLSGAAAEAQTSNTDWVNAQEYAFVTGAQSFDDWDKFTTEWLGRGGKDIITQTAQSLGVPVPDYAK